MKVYLIFYDHGWSGLKFESICETREIAEHEVEKLGGYPYIIIEQEVIDK